MKNTPSYSGFERQFPEYIIIKKIGCFYETFNKSAKVLSRVMEYKLYEDINGRLKAGGPDCDKIIRILKAEDYNFLIIENNKIVDGHSGRNPFEGL